MTKILYTLVAVLGLSAAAQAQQTPSRCPPLPAGTGLQWSEKASSGFLTCKARSDDGRQSLNVMLTSRDPDLRLSRSQRAEAGMFFGESLYWYVPQIAGSSEEFAASRRITVVKLGKDQYAQVWVDASSAADLARLQTLAGQLDVSAGASYLVSGK